MNPHQTPDEGNPFDPAAWREALSGEHRPEGIIDVAESLTADAPDLVGFMREHILGVDLGGPEPCAVLCTEGEDGVMHVEPLQYEPRSIDVTIKGEGSALQRAIRNLRPPHDPYSELTLQLGNGFTVRPGPRPGTVEYSSVVPPEPGDCHEGELPGEWTAEDQANHEEEVLRESEGIDRGCYECESGPDCCLTPEEAREQLAMPEAEPVSLNPKDQLARSEGKTRLDLLEPVAKRHCADALADGASKYGERNYREVPIAYRVYLGAMLRHIDALLSGEDYAPDSGVHHLGHIEANIHILLGADEEGTLVDDR